MKAEDIPLLWSVSSPSIAPDGASVVFAAGHASLDADAYVGQLFSVAVDGSGSPSRITRGFRDSSPAHSPDGSLIAFLRASAGSAPQLYLMPARGGEPQQLTDRLLGVGSFTWAPSGASIAFTSREPEHGRYGSIEKLDASAEAPRHITTIRYKSNGTGYISDRRTQVFTIAVPAVDAEPHYPAAPSAEERWSAAATSTLPEAVQLTTGDDDHGPLAWTPDSSALIVVAALHDERDTDLRAGLYRIPASGGAPELITPADSPLSVADVAITPDGTIFFAAQNMGESNRDFVGQSSAIYALVDAVPVQLTNPAATDFDEGHLSVASDSTVLAANRTRGTLELHEIALGDPETLASGTFLVTDHAARDDLRVVAVTTPTTSSELAVVENGELRFITSFATVATIEPRELEITGRDGYPVHGWVATPEGEGPHPVLLMIHGGPYSQYGVGFFDETQVFTEAGYAVVYCNPRGAAGYGTEHARSIRERMGTLDHFDVIDFLEGALAADERLDATRLGIMGGSYGGYLTAWTIAHDHRFTAAIVERGFLDPEVFPGTSDIGDFFGSEYMGSDPARMREQSPQAVVGSVATPTFVIHSEQDLRCPLGQAERYYASLRSQGVEAELLIFPGENHELSRAGRPRHRVQRFEAMLDWWNRYLPVRN